MHFCAKYNSIKCLENLLKYIYQEEPNNYHEVVQTKTYDGDTTLIVACRYGSNDALKVLLDLGGVDIYNMNLKKVTAYQIAFSDNNEEALRLLMKYELAIKEKNQLNIAKLSS